MPNHKKQPARKVEDLTKMQCGVSKCGCRLWSMITNFVKSICGCKGPEATIEKQSRVAPSTGKSSPTKTSTAKKPAAKKPSPKSTAKSTSKKSATTKKSAKKSSTTKKKTTAAKTTTKA